jgi:KUP system potassium uptake protein
MSSATRPRGREPAPRREDLTPGPRAQGGLAALTLGALGVVFGDIGTSPLYALKQVFHGPHPVPVETASVYGVLSLVFWSITIVVSVKYVLFIMRAGNEGEGGIMALIALVHRAVTGTPRAKQVLIALGAFGAALFFGDGMITPAISVLSAVEGLKVAAPSLDRFVIPITLVVLTMLFAIQRFGTGAVGSAFGPVMAAWFASLAAFGAVEIVRAPAILRALSPSYAVAFFADHGGTAFLALGSVVLAVTGAEALYADMGHFGVPSIRRAWFGLVLPALVVNYLGQGALLLHRPGAATNPFFRLVPDWAQIPMVILATVATVIASQAVISGAFSVTHQAVRLRFLPRVTIRHTSRRPGQIYVPVVTAGLFVATIGLVLAFRSSNALAAAYGIAVTGTLAIDTILFFVVVRTLWRKPLWVVIAGAAAFLTVDLAFLGANIPKVPHGGWFPLVVGAVIFTLLMTWRRGQEVVSRRRIEEEGPLQGFVHDLAASPDPPVRVRGSAVFLNASPDTTPLALRYNVEFNHVLHDQVVICSVDTAGVPHIDPERRVTVDDLDIRDDGIVLVRARFGFHDAPDVPSALRLAVAHGLEMDVDAATYFLSRITIVPARGSGMATWRKRLFTVMSRNAASPVRYFRLPDDRVVSIGGSITL